MSALSVRYDTDQGVDTIVPVDAYVPGYPPRPKAMIEGILNLCGDIMCQGLNIREDVL